MEDKTLLSFRNSTDKELADYMRACIDSYFDMSLTIDQIGVTSQDFFDDGVIMIAIQNRDKD